MPYPAILEISIYENFHPSVRWSLPVNWRKISSYLSIGSFRTNPSTLKTFIEIYLRITVVFNWHSLVHLKKIWFKLYCLWNLIFNTRLMKLKLLISSSSVQLQSAVWLVSKIIDRRHREDAHFILFIWLEINGNIQHTFRLLLFKSCNFLLANNNFLFCKQVF